MKKKYKIEYQFINSAGFIDDRIERNELRVPQVGDHILFVCRGDRYRKVIKVDTILTHNPNDVHYIVKIKHGDL